MCRRLSFFASAQLALALVFGCAVPDDDAAVAAEMADSTSNATAFASDAMAQVADAGGNGAVVAQADAGAERRPDPRFFVPASGPCPELRNGYVTFRPDGKPRQVLLYMSDKAKQLDGPLIFSWHTTLPGPDSAPTWLGSAVIEEIKAQGGIVAAPATGYPGATRPWDSIQGGPRGDGDQRLMDEVVACVRASVGIDTRRIHAIGMSAGGLKTAQVSLRRSGYLASVVVYSGGLVANEDPPDQDPTNPLSAMILYGGPRDISPVDGIPYQAASNRYLNLLRQKGRFGFLCDHGGGHSVPRDTQASAWRFLQDHPFGTQAYAAGFPAGFSRYCAKPPASAGRD